MNIEEKAEKLHALGHEVAAAALRRSALMAHPLVHRGNGSFDAFPVPRHQLGHFNTAHRLPRAIQPGMFNTVHQDHNLLADGTPANWAAARVGRTIGPITHEELNHLLGTQRPRHILHVHPLAAEGHGLHSSDPHHSSFKFLRDNIDRPDVWPIVADHFEEHGGHRAAAMARLLRENKWLDIPDLVGNNRPGVARHVQPVTWPVRVGNYSSHDAQGLNVGSKWAWLPHHQATEILHDLRR